MADTTFPRSGYDLCQGLAYFPRMLDKMRLHAAGRLPAEYVPYLEGGFNSWMTQFLGVSYGALREAVLSQNLSDEEALEWCYRNGRRLNEDLIRIWTGFATKRGWRDTRTESLLAEKVEKGITDPEVLTSFDLWDWEEGRRQK